MITGETNSNQLEKREKSIGFYCHKDKGKNIAKK